MNSHINIDHKREERIGFQEVVFGASKSVEQLKLIINDFKDKNKNVFCTKLQNKKAQIFNA